MSGNKTLEKIEEAESSVKVSPDSNSKWLILLGPVTFIVILIISVIIFGIENLKQFFGF